MSERDDSLSGGQPPETEPLGVEPDAGASGSEAHVDDSDEGDWPWSERLFSFLERTQWVHVVVFVSGLGLLFFEPRWGGIAIGTAVVMAGLVPMITGRYRGPLGTLRGTGARLRGLVSVGMGAFILSLALAL